MEIINISPRGYCYGVVDAMVIARNASLDESLPRPIYILGMIVHNEHITKAFKEVGIQTLDGSNREEILQQIEKGTVIFTAHGTSPKVKQAAKDKGLVTIDATCPDVMITHELIADKVDQGFDIIYIGKAQHPEPEGAIGVAPNHVFLVSSLEDIEQLHLDNPSLFVTNQTTMSQWDVADLMEAIQEKYPHAQLHHDICKATQVRQEAVVEQAKDCDLTLVVGDPRSNNSNRLAQVSEEQVHVKAYRISDVSQIKHEWLMGIHKVAVTAGASTPTHLVREVIHFLEQFDEENKKTWTATSSVTTHEILPKARIKDISQKRQKKLADLRANKCEGDQ